MNEQDPTITEIEIPASNRQNGDQGKGRKAVLTFDRHARFRYGRHGGKLNSLLSVPGQDYFQSVLLIWAALDEESRKRYPDPALLVDHIAEDAEHIFMPALEAVCAAGWLKLDEKAQS